MPENLQPPALPVPLPQHSGVNWRAALAPALLGGLVTTVVNLFIGAAPVAAAIVVCIVAPALGGAFAALLYRRKMPHLTVTQGEGSRVGALAGLAGFAYQALLAGLSLVLVRAAGQGGAFREQLRKQLQASDPNAAAQFDKLTPELIAVMVVMAMVGFLFASVVFSSAGGALFAALRGSKRP